MNIAHLSQQSQHIAEHATLGAHPILSTTEMVPNCDTRYLQIPLLPRLRRNCYTNSKVTASSPSSSLESWHRHSDPFGHPGRPKRSKGNTMVPQLGTSGSQGLGGNHWLRQAFFRSSGRFMSFVLKLPHEAATEFATTNTAAEAPDLSSGQQECSSTCSASA